MSQDRAPGILNLLRRYRFRLLFLAVCMVPVWFFFEDSLTSSDSLTGEDADRAFHELLHGERSTDPHRFEWVELVVRRRGESTRSYAGPELQRRLEILATTPRPLSLDLAGRTRRKICRFAVREAQGQVLEGIVYDFGDGTPVWVRFPACGVRIFFYREFLNALF